jgi:hypothetical protein
MRTNIFLYIRVDVQQSLSHLSHREFLIWKERGRGWGGERERGRWVGQQAGRFKVRLGLGAIEGRDGDR